MAMNTLISAVKAYVAGAVAKLPSREDLKKIKDEADGKYLKKTSAAQFVTRDEANEAYAPNDGTLLTTSAASNTYLKKIDAENAYLTKTKASNTYLSISEAASTYLKLSIASSTYLESEDAKNTYLAKTDAKNTYLVKTDAESAYAKKTGLTDGSVNAKFKDLDVVNGGSVAVESVDGLSDARLSENLLIFSTSESSTTGGPQGLIRFKNDDGIPSFSFQSSKKVAGVILNHNPRLRYVGDPEEDTDAATKNYVDAAVAAPVLTSPSGKKFKLAVDDSGTLSATEVTE